MKELLSHFLKLEGLTSSKLAEIMDVQPSNISHILSGRSKPGFDFLTRFLTKFPNINPDWLLLGDNNMYRDSSASSTETVDDKEFDTDLFRQATSSQNEIRNNISNDLFSNIPISKGHSVQNNIKVGIDRIIIIYDDKTFESLSSKK